MGEIYAEESAEAEWRDDGFEVTGQDNDDHAQGTLHDQRRIDDPREATRPGSIRGTVIFVRVVGVPLTIQTVLLFIVLMMYGMESDASPINFLLPVCDFFIGVSCIALFLLTGAISKGSTSARGGLLAVSIVLMVSGMGFIRIGVLMIIPVGAGFIVGLAVASLYSLPSNEWFESKNRFGLHTSILTPRTIISALLAIGLTVLSVSFWANSNEEEREDWFSVYYPDVVYLFTGGLAVCAWVIFLTLFGRDHRHRVGKSDE